MCEEIVKTSSEADGLFSEVITVVACDPFKMSYTSLAFRFFSCFDVYNYVFLVYCFHFQDIEFLVKLQ